MRSRAIMAPHAAYANTYVRSPRLIFNLQIRPKLIECFNPD